MTPKISEAVSELQNAVGQASFIFHRGDKNTVTGEDIAIKSLSGASVYEKNRAIRRIDRACELLLISAKSEAEKVSIKNRMYLDEYSVNCLIDIVIEFRQESILSLPSSSDDSDEDSEIGTRAEKKRTIKCLCNQTVITACEILDCYATLPLHSKHVDRLLDCTASMALTSGIFHSGILGLINNSIFAHDSKHENDAEIEDTMDYIGSEPISFETRDSQSFSHSTQSTNQNMNESSILLLDAMETMTLIQFLTKHSLKHLSEPWIFPDSSRDHSHSLSNQENMVQLRVLIGYVLRHFSSKLQSFKNIHNGDEISRKENLSLTFEMKLLALYDNNNLETAHVKDNYENQSHFLQGETIEGKKTKVEDFIDLLTSFYSEIIEYALYVLDSSTNFFHSKEKASPNHLYMQNKKVSTRSNVLLPIDGNVCNRDNYDSPTMELIYFYLRDAIRHTSLAVGIIEVLCEDLSLFSRFSIAYERAIRINLDDIAKLWIKFAEFVALYCSIEYFERMSDKLQVQNHSIEHLINKTFSCANDVLIRLYKLSDAQPNKVNEKAINISLMRKGNTAYTVTMLRLVSSLQNFSIAENVQVTNNSSEVLKSVLDDISDNLHYIPKRLRDNSEDDKQGEWPCRNVRARHLINKNNNENSLDENRISQQINILSSETVKIIQATALSSLILPQQHSCLTNQTFESSDKEEVLRHKRPCLSRIVQCLLSNTMKDRAQDNEKDKRQKGLNNSKLEPCLVDAFNPWHSILANKIIESIPGPLSGELKSLSSTSNPKEISMSAASTISDLSSQFTPSNDYTAESLLGEGNHMIGEKDMCNHVYYHDDDILLQKYALTIKSHFATL